MSDYIKREDAVEALNRHKKTFSCGEDNSKERYAYMQHLADFKAIEDIPTADVVEADKAQKEIDYWHDKAQSYEQTILKLSLNKADVVEVVRCKDCKYRSKEWYEDKRHKDGGYWLVCCENDAIAERVYGLAFDYDYCSYGEKEEG